MKWKRDGGNNPLLHPHSGIVLAFSRATAQQKEGPQVPPLKPVEPPEDENEPIPQAKEETSFFTSLEPQRGHVVSCSELPTFCKTVKVSLHLLHMYS